MDALKFTLRLVARGLIYILLVLSVYAGVLIYLGMMATQLQPIRGTVHECINHMEKTEACK